MKTTLGQPRFETKDKQMHRMPLGLSDLPMQPLLTEDGVNYFDSRNVTDDELLRQLLRTNLPVRFDWENKWLRGD
jgi:hypothetical protein